MHEQLKRIRNENGMNNVNDRGENTKNKDATSDKYMLDYYTKKGLSEQDGRAYVESIKTREYLSLGCKALFLNACYSTVTCKLQV